MAEGDNRGGAIVLSRYRPILNEMFADGGGEGDTIPAHDMRLGCLVDIVAAPAPLGTPMGDLFARRAGIVASLRHPALPFVHDMGIDGSRMILVYRRIDFHSPRDARDRAGDAWTVERARRIVADLAGALGVAHAAGLCHGSVSMESVSLQPDGTAMLTDLVWPRSLRAARGRDIAPEMRDALMLNPRDDVYALGALLHELLPLRATADDGASYAAALHVARRATAWRPEERYAEGAEMARALDASASGAIGGFGSPTLGTPTIVPAARSIRPSLTGRTANAPARQHARDGALAVGLIAALVLGPLLRIATVGGAHTPLWGPRHGFGQPFGDHQDGPDRYHDGPGAWSLRP
jgi:hypothetical protein